MTTVEAVLAEEEPAHGLVDGADFESGAGVPARDLVVDGLEQRDLVGVALSLGGGERSGVIGSMRS